MSHRVYQLAFSTPRPLISLIAVLAGYAVLLVKADLAGLGVAAFLTLLDTLPLSALRVRRRSLMLAALYAAAPAATDLLGLRCGAAVPAVLGVTLWYGLAATPMMVLRAVAGFAAALYVGADCCLIYGISLALFATAIAWIMLKGGSPRLAIAYATSWIDLYDLLELEAKRRGCREDVRSVVLEYVLDNGTLRLAVSDVHYGPFRRLSGAIIPYHLMDAGFIPLHAPVTHDRNPCTNSDAERVVTFIQDEASRKVGEVNRSYLVLGAEPVKLEGGYRIRFFPAPLPLAIVDRPGLGIDDPEASPRSKLVLVDAHNEELSQPGSGLPKDIRPARLRIVEASRCLIGYSRIRVTDHERLGLCAPWVATIATSCGKERLFLVVLPSNNAERGLRARVELLMSALGSVILTTIDDHKCVGARPGVAELKAKSSSLLINYVMQSVFEALRAVKPVQSATARIVSTRICLWCDLYRDTRRLERAWLAGYLAAFAPFAPLVLEAILRPLMGG